jgi:hypothetical protein
MRRIIFFAVTFAALATVVACSSSHEQDTTPHAVATVRDITLTTAERTSVPDWLEAVGNVRGASRRRRKPGDGLRGFHPRRRG